MTKAGIDHLTRCLANEWAQYNIRVNAVAPTFIWTDGTKPALSDPAFPEADHAPAFRWAASANPWKWPARSSSSPRPPRR